MRKFLFSLFLVLICLAFLKTQSFADTCGAYLQANTCNTQPDGGSKAPTMIIDHCTNSAGKITYFCFNPSGGQYGTFYTQQNSCTADPLGLDPKASHIQGHTYLVNKRVTNGQTIYNCVADCSILSAPHCPAPTSKPSPSLSPKPSPSSSPSPSPSTSPTPNPTLLSLALQLPGIGQGGNLSPQHTTRILHVSIYASGVDPTQPNVTPVFDSKNFSVNYNSTTGYFTNAAVNVGNLATGDYQLLVKTPGYLRKQFVDSSSDTKTIHIVGGTTTAVPVITLIAGDVAPLFNVMDISDFYAIVGCYGAKASTSSCAVGNQITDINDDGAIDGVDLNYWLLGFQTLLNNNDPQGNGDGVPGD